MLKANYRCYDLNSIRLKWVLLVTFILICTDRLIMQRVAHSGGNEIIITMANTILFSSRYIAYNMKSSITPPGPK